MDWVKTPEDAETSGTQPAQVRGQNQGQLPGTGRNILQDSPGSQSWSVRSDLRVPPQASSTTRPAPRRTSMCGRSLNAWWTSSVWRCLSVWMWRLRRLRGPRPPDWAISLRSCPRSAADRYSTRLHLEPVVVIFWLCSALVQLCSVIDSPSSPSLHSELRELSHQL